MFNNTITK